MGAGNLLPQRKRFRAELCDGCFHGELPARIATLRGGRLPDHQAGFSPRGAHYPGGKPHFRQRRPLRTLPDEGSDEIARLAQAFNAMLDRLEAAFEREKQFTSDASHELRTPISVILSQADFALANPGDPQETLRRFRRFNHRVKKMSALVAQLLELTRADNQTLRLEKEPIDLATLCETVAEELAERADKRGISIECLLQPEVMLEGDQTLLTRMMMNLVSNAISYGKEYGHIWIRLIQKDTGIRLSIEDDGIGIAPEHINRIFDRFYRVDSSRSGAQGGSAGLGLAMVRWIVQAHDGTIQVESEPGKGSAFLVIFPT